MPQAPTSLLSLSDSFYLTQQQTARVAASRSQAAWRGMPSSGLRDMFAYWRTAIPDVANVVGAAQFENASRAGMYVATAALVQDTASTDVPAIEPRAFVTPAEDVEQMLEGPMHHLAALVLNGAPASTAQTIALSTLVRHVTTLAQDAGREATGVGIAVHPGIDGYYRRLRLPSCKRCAVLAGAYYARSAGFLRHPVCDCVHVPAATEYDDGEFDATDAIAAGRISGLSEADRRAILDDGADLGQIVNARAKGAVTTTEMFGKRVETTTAGTSKRGVRPGKQRLTPSAIYDIAGNDRAAARRLLERHGYVS